VKNQQLRDELAQRTARKAGISDRIPLKPGRLSAEEFEIMKTHTVLHHDAIANAKRALPGLPA
jgi:HD-GYP domain-containing protein (c-di-GMP phosphodiesterase class II)